MRLIKLSDIVSRFVVMEKLTRSVVRSIQPPADRDREGSAATRLHTNTRRRRGDHGIQNARHHPLFLFRRLIGIHQRRAINPLERLSSSRAQQFRRVCFERGELAPAPPVLRLRSAIDTHGGDVAVGAAESAVSRRSKRMREPGFGDESGGGRENSLTL